MEIYIVECCRSIVGISLNKCNSHNKPRFAFSFLQLFSTYN